MRSRWRLGISACVIGNVLLWAQTNPPGEQKQEPSVASPPQSPQGDATQPFFAQARFCSQKYPPPCVTPPHPVFTPDPEYSNEAREAHLQGKCVLWLIVGTDGRVYNLKVARALGSGLDEKAMEAVRQWVFQPAIKDGKPVAVQLNVEVSFRLSAVAVSPTSAQVVTGSQQQFSAIVSTPSEAPSSAVNWSVSGSGCVTSACGSISPDGLYTAPLSVPTPPTIIVTATSATDPTKKGWAKVTILPRPSR